MVPLQRACNHLYADKMQIATFFCNKTHNGKLEPHPNAFLSSLVASLKQSDDLPLLSFSSFQESCLHACARTKEEWSIAKKEFPTATDTLQTKQVSISHMACVQ